VPKFKIILEYGAREPFLPFDYIRLAPGKDNQSLRELFKELFVKFAQFNAYLDKDGKPISMESISHVTPRNNRISILYLLAAQIILNSR
jgi:hypothetical protein